ASTAVPPAHSTSTPTWEAMKFCETTIPCLARVGWAPVARADVGASAARNSTARARRALWSGFITLASAREAIRETGVGWGRDRHGGRPTAPPGRRGRGGPAHAARRLRALRPDRRRALRAGRGGARRAVAGPARPHPRRHGPGQVPVRGPRPGRARDVLARLLEHLRRLA